MKQTAERLELECSILGTAIRESECTAEILTTLTVEDFGHDVTKSIFAALRALFAHGSPIDRITVIHELGSDDYGAFIDGCIAARLPKTNLSHYLQILRERSRLDEIQEKALAVSVAESLREVAEPVEAINTLMMARRQWKGIGMLDAVNSFVDRLSDNTPPVFLKTGFPRLDAELYMQPGDMVVIGGEPSSGKTVLATQFAVTLAKAGHRVGFFSLETSAEKLTDRIMAQQGQIPLSGIKQKALSPEEWRKAAETAQSLSGLALEIIPAAGMSVSDIQAYSLARSYDVIFVDYLQIVADVSESRYEAVTRISIALHTLSQSCGITVFALAQLSRPEKPKRTKNGSLEAYSPTMHDLKESGQVEQDADIVLLLYKEKYDGQYDSPRKLKIGKNKEGRLKIVDLKFTGSTVTFAEDEPDHWVYAENATQKKNGEPIRSRDRQDKAPEDEKFEQLSAFIKETF